MYLTGSWKWRLCNPAKGIKAHTCQKQANNGFLPRILGTEVFRKGVENIDPSWQGTIGVGAKKVVINDYSPFSF